MSQQNRLRYEDFWDSINVDSFEEAIGWSPEHTHNDNDIGFCPFPENHAHGDTTGKFAIEREMRVYNCWACGGGSLLSLAMELLAMDIDEATRWIYQFTETDARSDAEFVDEFIDAFRDAEKRIATLPYFNDRVLDRFNESVPDEWLESRGISQEIVDKYGVRYLSAIQRPSPRAGRFGDEEDYIGPGVIFPHYWQDRLVGWQTRWLEEDRPEWVPKYTMTSDFPKETTVYGWDQVKTSEAVVVVESVPTALLLASEGFAAVATFGSNVNDAQMRLLRRFPEILLAADNDKPSKEGRPAGLKWRDQLTTYLKKYSVVRWVPLVPEAGSDLGDVKGGQQLEEYLEAAYDPALEMERCTHCGWKTCLSDA